MKSKFVWLYREYMGSIGKFQTSKSCSNLPLKMVEPLGLGNACVTASRPRFILAEKNPKNERQRHGREALMALDTI